MRLNLDKHLRIKISEKSLTQRFDVSMTSKCCVKLFSSFLSLNINLNGVNFSKTQSLSFDCFHLNGHTQ